MAEKIWETVKVRYCHHVGEDIEFEAQLVYPAEWLPEQNPRVLAHRCSRAIACNLDNRASCVLAGTNPAIDPFTESD